MTVQKGTSSSQDKKKKHKKSYTFGRAWEAMVLPYKQVRRNHLKMYYKGKMWADVF